MTKDQIEHDRETLRRERGLENLVNVQDKELVILKKMSFMKREIPGKKMVECGLLEMV